MKQQIVIRMLAGAILATGIVCAALPAWPQTNPNQTYPNRPIHFIVNYVPGGTGDIIARLIAGRLSERLGQSVIVENHSGAGGTVGARDVINAEPDGYTISVAQTPEIAINPYFMKDVGYDPLADLRPIALGGNVPLALVVPANAAYSTLADFLTFLRTTDKTVTFASGGVGTSGHFAGELLKLKYNSRLTHVPYKGAGQALTDVISGQVDFYFPGLIAALPMVKAGKLKLLAVATTKRSPTLPDVPTVAEATGIADFEFTLWAGFFAPRGISSDLATRLNDGINNVIAEPAIKARLQDNGAEVTPMSIAQFSRFVKDEADRYQAIIKEANLKPE